MRVAIDLGNTRLKWRVDGGATHAADHAAADFDARWAAVVAALPRDARVHLASVADDALAARVAAPFADAGVPVRRVRVIAEHAGLRVCYARPQDFGVDRWLALLAARARHDGAVLVASCGTALTVDVCDADGRHRGGWIAPSPALMAQALRERARHLPAPSQPRGGFACDSADAIAEGCLAAAVGLLSRAFDEASTLPGAPPAALLTGGGMADVAALLDRPHRLVPDLVLEGIDALDRTAS